MRENDVAVGIPPTCLQSPCSFFLISALFIDTPVNVSPNFGMPLSPLRCGIHLGEAQPRSRRAIRISDETRTKNEPSPPVPTPHHSIIPPLHSAALPAFSQHPQQPEICTANGVCVRDCVVHTFCSIYVHITCPMSLSVKVGLYSCLLFILGFIVSVTCRSTGYKLSL